MDSNDLRRAKNTLIQMCATYPGNYWSLAIEEYMAAVGIEMEGLKCDVRHAESAYSLADNQLKEMTANRDELGRSIIDYREAIAMQEQNARAFSIREKELVDQNDALRSANSSIHTARLDDLTDIKNLKEQVRKLGQDVQGLMNPVEIGCEQYGTGLCMASYVSPATVFEGSLTDSPCQCNSCKWERHNASQKITNPTGTNGYGVVGRPREDD